MAILLSSAFFPYAREHGRMFPSGSGEQPPLTCAETIEAAIQDMADFVRGDYESLLDFFPLLKTAALDRLFSVDSSTRWVTVKGNAVTLELYGHCRSVPGARPTHSHFEGASLILPKDGQPRCELVDLEPPSGLVHSSPVKILVVDPTPSNRCYLNARGEAIPQLEKMSGHFYSIIAAHVYQYGEHVTTDKKLACLFTRKDLTQEFHAAFAASADKTRATAPPPRGNISMQDYLLSIKQYLWTEASEHEGLTMRDIFKVLVHQPYVLAPFLHFNSGKNDTGSTHKVVIMFIQWNNKHAFELHSSNVASSRARLATTIVLPALAMPPSPLTTLITTV